jgi:hypothetical protein
MRKTHQPGAAITGLAKAADPQTLLISRHQRDGPFIDSHVILRL